MKILIVDNYDSFTYNIVHYVEQFVNCCTVIKVDNIDIKQIKLYDKIILSPGPGLPNERPILNEIIQKYHQQKPILGICLGHQALAEYFGAKLFNMDNVHHGIARDTSFLGQDYLWGNTPLQYKTGRYHSWAIKKESLPDTLKIIAEDSLNKTIMAFSHKELDIKGIQFHPESILTENGKTIIKNWIEQK